MNDEYKDNQKTTKTRYAFLKKLIPAMAGILLIAIIAIVVGNTFPHFNILTNILPHSGGPLLPGADKIYPTICVNGNLYEWTRMYAYDWQEPQKEALKEWEYVGKLIHVDGKKPQNDCEFVSKFSATGDIYIDPKSDANIYVLIKTDWVDQEFVVFSKAENSSSDAIETSMVQGQWDIAPKVMVHGDIYGWDGMYAANIYQHMEIVIPESWKYYGDVIRVNGSIPKGDCEFVSNFSATGEIYIDPYDDSTVYILLTTPWLENKYVEFKK